MNKSIYVVIPVFNEEHVIGEVLREIKKQGIKHIIVVDDGSTDRTAQEAAAHSTDLRHMLNRGKGAAAKTAIEAAKLLGADIIVTMDGDGQHNPADIHTMLKTIDDGYDVVLGVRAADTSMPASRRFANLLGNIATWILYGLWVNDSQCGFRAYTRKALMKMETLNDRYEYDSEIIRELAVHHLRFAEVPVETRYTAYSMNKRHKQSVVNGLRTLLRMIVSA